MKKNSFLHCIAVGLAATLALSGCDSGGSDQVLGSGGTGTGGSGGSGSATGVTGTGGMGLTGGTVPTTGGTGGTNGGTSGGTSGTTDGSTDGSTTDGGTTPTPLENFTRNVQQRSGVTTTSPSQMAVLNGRVYFLQGAGLNGGLSRLMSAPITGTGATLALGAPVVVTAGTGTPTGLDALQFPFGLVSDGSALYISVGCNPPTGALGQGRILKVTPTVTGSNVSGVYLDLTATAGITPVEPSFMFVRSGSLYWSQFSASAGEIWRIPTAGGTAVRLAEGLNFPAGIDTDGTSIVIANSGLNQILKMPIAGGPTTVVTAPATGDINRPFDVEYDNASGFFITQGTSLSETNSVGTALPILYLPQTGTAARIAVNAVFRAADLESVSLGDGDVGIVYAEDNPSGGRLMRAVFDTTSTSAVTPVQLSTAATYRPFSVAVLSQTTPAFLTSVNFFNRGTDQGLIDLYRP